MKRILSFLIALAICLSVISVASLAAEASYYVAGASGLCGSNWNPGDPNNKMESKGNNLYEISYEGIPKGTYEFKVTIGNWSDSWGANGGEANYKLTLTEPSDVTITFNSSTKAINVKTTPAKGAVPDVEYFLVGINGQWEAVEANKLTEKSDGTYTITKSLTAGSYGYKIMSSIGSYYPDGTGNETKFELAAVSDVTFTFTPVTGEHTYEILNPDAIVEPTPSESAYYIAGTDGLCGSNWSCNDTKNKLTKNEDGTYSKTYENIPAGAYEFKVTDGTWTNSWGKGSGNYTFNLEVPSEVTISFNSATHEITVSSKEVDDAPPAPVYDYYVAGSKDLCGVEWDPCFVDNKMSLNDDGTYSKTYENIPAGAYEFKITDGTWTNSWGKDGGSDNYAINLPAVSNVTITFNSETKTITVDIACQHKNTKIEGGSPATCGKVGSTGTTICVDCEKILKDAEEIPALDHKPAEKWTSDATNHWHICENGCGELLEKAKHTYANGACTSCGHSCSHNFKDGACTICNLPCEHKYENSVCTVCGLGCTHEYVDGVCKHCKISCTHSYKDGKCETCGIECTHTTELQGAKAATCTEAGHEGNLVCTICNKVVKQGNEIPALNHKNTETHVEGAKDATCGAAGHTGKTICECGATISEGEEIPATGNHNYKDGTCSVCGGKDPNYVAPANRILYVKPNAGWLESEARFAAYFFNDGGNTWVDCTASSVAGVWQVEIPADFADGQVIFCRMNPATTENNWDNKWNQTSDLPIPAANDNKTCYHVVGWDHGAGQWTKLGDEPEAVKTIYYVAGSFGTEGWNKHHQMTESADGASWSLSMDLKAGTYEYKVKDNGTGWWPETNVQLVLEQDATVEFTIDVATKAVTHKITPKSVEPEDTTPETTAPEDTTPEDTTPEDTTPETTEPKPTTPDNPDTIVVYAQVPESWTDVGVYIWDASGKYDAAWPGIQMTKGADGWYTAEVPAWAENIIINNNGNGAQTQDMAITVGRDLWIVVEAAESGFVGTVSYESAKTGDSTNLIALSVAMLLAAAGMVTLVVKKKEF